MFFLEAQLTVSILDRLLILTTKAHSAHPLFALTNRLLDATFEAVLKRDKALNAAHRGQHLTRNVVAVATSSAIRQTHTILTFEHATNLLISGCSVTGWPRLPLTEILCALDVSLTLGSLIQLLAQVLFLVMHALRLFTSALFVLLSNITVACDLLISNTRALAHLKPNCAALCLVKVLLARLGNSKQCVLSDTRNHFHAQLEWT